MIDDIVFASEVWKRHFDNGNLIDNYRAGECLYNAVKKHLEDIMKPIELIDWNWMRRNLHEQGFEKIVEKLNEIIEKTNELSKEEKEK